MGDYTRRRLLGTAVIGLAGAMAGCTRPTGGEVTGWPSWRRDPARTGYNPDGAGPSRGHVSWTKRVSGAAGPPIAAGSTVYVGGEQIIALDGTSGEVHWRHPVGFATTEAPATVAGEIFAVGRSSLLSLAGDTGHRAWVETNDIWRYHVPTIAAGGLYLGMTKTKYSTAFDARLVSLDLDGTIRWRVPVGATVLPPFAVAVGGNRAVVGRDRVYAVDAGTGERAWTFDDPDVAAFGDPVIAGETVYVGATRPTGGVPAGTFFALSATDGTERWRFETALTPSAPAVTPTGIYLTADRVIALDPSGKPQWTVGDNQFVTASPSVGSERVYLAGIDGRVQALDRTTGDRIWKRTTPGSLLHAPAVIGGRLFVSSFDGYLLAIDR